MGLFDNKPKKEIEKLEKALAESPIPINFVNLAKKYSESGDPENALRIAQQGIDLFPDAEDVIESFVRLKKNQVSVELENLKKVIEQRPNHIVFIQMAEIYKELRDEESALKYCRQAIDLFPNHDSPYLIIGELRLRRFYKDFLVKDGQLAMTNLEKAFNINQRNYKALLALSKFYLQIGAISKAEDRLVRILRFAPEDDIVQDLLETCKKVPRQNYEDVDILLRTVEDQRRLYYNLKKEEPKSDRVTLTPEMFQNSLQAIKESDGITCLLICEEDAKLITYYMRAEIDINLYYEVAKIIYGTLQDSSRQMDIGRFQRGQIETPLGSIHIIGSGGVIYVAFGIKETKPDYICKRLQTFISQVSPNVQKGAMNA